MLVFLYWVFSNRHLERNQFRDLLVRGSVKELKSDTLGPVYVYIRDFTLTETGRL